MQKCPSGESGRAGKAESCKGCPNASICASSKPDEDIPLIRSNLKPIKLILAVLSGKGGVGKSTISRNIASSISKLGISTVLLDFDISGPSIPRLTNTDDLIIMNTSGRFSPIVADGLGIVSIGHLEHTDDLVRVYDVNTKHYVIKKILKHCDFDGFSVMVIDTPPNITEEHLALVNYIKPDYSIMVTTPQHLSLNDVKRQISFCRKTGLRIMGLIENMRNFVCPNCTHTNVVYPSAETESFCKSEGIEFLGSIPLQAQVAKNSDSGIPVYNEIFERVARTVGDLLQH